MTTIVRALKTEWCAQSYLNENNIAHARQSRQLWKEISIFETLEMLISSGIWDNSRDGVGFEISGNLVFWSHNLVGRPQEWVLVRLQFWWGVFTAEGKRWSWSTSWHLGTHSYAALGDFLGVIQGAELCDGSKPQCLVTVMLKCPEILFVYLIHHKYHLLHHPSPLGRLQLIECMHGLPNERKLGSLYCPFPPAWCANSAWTFWELFWGNGK